MTVKAAAPGQSGNAPASAPEEDVAAGTDPVAIRPIHPAVNVHFHRGWCGELARRRAQNGPWDHWELARLAFEAADSMLVRSFDELQCLRHLPRLVPMPHQTETARRVLCEMRGRAVLADEVGLGKTIEAGLILKEYIVRGLVRKALILVPASLVLQWVRELNQKFGIPAVAHKKTYMWTQYDFIVASLDTAKRDPHREIVLAQDYDLLIVDEAHKLKNKKTSNYQFVQHIRKKYCLLLTATPIQNDLGELYNLITMLKPGQLGGQGRFQSDYVVGKRVPKNETLLKEELAKVMIRNRRSDGGIAFTNRHVKNVPLRLSPEEQALYDGVTDFVRQRYREAGIDAGSMLSLVTLQREVCSSRDAVFITLVNLFKKMPEDSPYRARIWDLINLIKQITANTKAEKTLELIGGMEDKVIVFTEYRATQEYLLKFFKDHGLIAVPYRGGMNRGKKDWMMDLFRSRAKVLVATEAGGEGINLQFCHNIVNFDLPWNPMRVEQRIGRVHRLGQEHDVHIYNLCTLGTIEEHIVHLLHEKINMFELVIGELDTILEQLQQDASLEQRIGQILLEARSDEEIRGGLDTIGQSFQMIRSRMAGGDTAGGKHGRAGEGAEGSTAESEAAGESRRAGRAGTGAARGGKGSSAQSAQDRQGDRS